MLDDVRVRSRSTRTARISPRGRDDRASPEPPSAGASPARGRRGVAGLRVAPPSSTSWRRGRRAGASAVASGSARRGSGGGGPSGASRRRMSIGGRGSGGPSGSTSPSSGDVRPGGAAGRGSPASPATAPNSERSSSPAPGSRPPSAGASGTARPAPALGVLPSSPQLGTLRAARGRLARRRRVRAGRLACRRGRYAPPGQRSSGSVMGPASTGQRTSSGSRICPARAGERSVPPGRAPSVAGANGPAGPHPGWPSSAGRSARICPGGGRCAPAVLGPGTPLPSPPPGLGGRGVPGRQLQRSGGATATAVVPGPPWSRRPGPGPSSSGSRSARRRRDVGRGRDAAQGGGESSAASPATTRARVGPVRWRRGPWRRAVRRRAGGRLRPARLVVLSGPPEQEDRRRWQLGLVEGIGDLRRAAARASFRPPSDRHAAPGRGRVAAAAQGVIERRGSGDGRSGLAAGAVSGGAAGAGAAAQRCRRRARRPRPWSGAPPPRPAGGRRRPPPGRARPAR